MRSARYTSKGSASVRRSKRWLSTTWKMSPARMCSCARPTRATKSARLTRDAPAPAPKAESSSPGRTTPCSRFVRFAGDSRDTTSSSRRRPAAIASSRSSTHTTMCRSLSAASKMAMCVYSAMCMSGSPRSSAGAP